MPSDFDAQCEAVTTPSHELVRAYREQMRAEREGEEASTASLTVVCYRASQTEFDLGSLYARSTDALDRATGAEILGQLGWRRDCFHDESVDILIGLLSDTDDDTIASAGYALGHRNDARAIPFVLPLIHHTNPNVRLAAAAGLAGHEDPAAIAGLIVLAGDTDRDVRNWSAFYLGSIIDTDTPDIREALAPLLNEEDGEIRGEALMGLARRRDPRALPALIRELEGAFEGSWCLEAAELLADPILVPKLVSLRAMLDPVDEGKFASEFDRAVAACQSPSAVVPEEVAIN
jgi:hypothetical protein